MSHLEVEHFLFGEGSAESEADEEVIEGRSSNKWDKEQALQNEELRDESQQQRETIPENENANNEIAPVITTDYNNLSSEEIIFSSGIKRVPFKGKPRLNASIISSQPIQIFEDFFIDELIKHIVYYTNLFAEQSIVEKQLKGKWKINFSENSWQSLTPNYILLYITVLIYQGLIWKPTVHMYHTKNIPYQHQEYQH